MRLAGREIPEVAFIDIADIWPAQCIENCHATSAVSHDRPLGSLMPVQFPNAPGGQSHVDPGDRVRNREVFLCYLTCPATVLDALRRVVEGGPVHGHAADVGCRRKLG